MRECIYQIIEVADDGDNVSKVYDWFMMIIIVASLLPIAVTENNTYLSIIENTTTVIFIVDYILRLMTSDIKLKKGIKSFVIYPFTFMAIIDLLSIAPTLLAVNPAFRVLKVLRLFRTFRVLRVFKVIRYSKSITIIVEVIKKQREPLFVVGGFAIGYILVSALVIFSVEPDAFQTFFDAVYWATVSLTTVGYGDIYAVSTVGKIITMISAFCGVAIVALPTGIITAGYMDEVNLNKNQKNFKGEGDYNEVRNEKTKFEKEPESKDNGEG